MVWLNVRRRPRHGDEANDTARFHQTYHCVTCIASTCGNGPAIDPGLGALSPAARPAQFDSTIYHGFSQGMRELGYVEGKDYLIEWRFADGDYARLPELAKELVGLKVKVLVATSTAAIQAAHKVTTAIPIVMVFYEDDPIGYGLAASFGHPAGNVTGLAAMGVEIVSKSLDLVGAILPNLNRFGILEIHS